MVETIKRTQLPTFLCEVEVTEGLEFVTEIELQQHHAQVVARRPGEIDFSFSGDLRALLRLKTAQTVALVQRFAVPRPRGLLSNEHLPLLLRQIEIVRSLAPPDANRTFFIAAAGSETAIMQRIKAAIAEQTGLALGDNKGDLGIRIRPGREGEWETVVRLTPRPLVTRSWRVCNLEGALNAATAHAMIMLTRPQPSDLFVNLGCGSGTFLIERLAYGQTQIAIGFDNDAAHLHCARANIEASGNTSVIQLQLADMTRLPLRSASVNVLCADLPFGQLSGTHHENERLYPLVLDEAARVAQPGARFVLITHEVHLMEALLRPIKTWSLEQVIPLNLRGLHPRIYLLRRSTLS